MCGLDCTVLNEGSGLIGGVVFVQCFLSLLLLFLWEDTTTSFLFYRWKATVGMCN